MQAFVSARERDYEAAISDELEFMRMTYWDNFAAKLNAAGYRLSERHIAVSAASFRQCKLQQPGKRISGASVTGNDGC